MILDYTLQERLRMALNEKYRNPRAKLRPLEQEYKLPAKILTRVRDGAVPEWVKRELGEQLSQARTILRG